MTPVSKETIEASTRALPAVNRYFPMLVAAAALAFIGLLVWKLMSAQIEVLEKMSQHIADLDSDLRAFGVPVGVTAQKRRATVQAVERE